MSRSPKLLKIAKSVNAFINNYNRLKLAGIILNNKLENANRYSDLGGLAVRGRCFSGIPSAWGALKVSTSMDEVSLSVNRNWNPSECLQPGLNRDEEDFFDHRAQIMINDILRRTDIKYRVPRSIINSLVIFRNVYNLLSENITKLHKALLNDLPWKSVSRYKNGNIMANWDLIIKYSSKQCRNSYYNYGCLAGKIIKCFLNLKYLKEHNDAA